MKFTISIILYTARKKVHLEEIQREGTKNHFYYFDDTPVGIIILTGDYYYIRIKTRLRIVCISVYIYVADFVNNLLALFHFHLVFTTTIKLVNASNQIDHTILIALGYIFLYIGLQRSGLCNELIQDGIQLLALFAQLDGACLQLLPRVPQLVHGFGHLLQFADQEVSIFRRMFQLE